ncbi:hypothetical protein VM1G_09352 [Cytospora mali]|uniref:Uncharacterized protein n=1 Tax=Cytospora mali TaxID=578113 RepID=A0A194WD61_CYTMA|nr:hypothetical protein VM1G_09352 [Valsa mali]
MSPPPDKRGAAASSKGQTHLFRGGSPRKEVPASSSNSTSTSTSTPTPTPIPASNPTPSASRTNKILATPPRAPHSSSPSPEAQSRTPSISSGSPSASNGTAGAIPRKSSSSSSSNAPNPRVLAISALSSTADKEREKEKDLRIASLERELSVMEAEFRRELDMLSQNESEAASFWQAKHSALNQHFLRTDMELRLLRDEVRAREAQAQAQAGAGAEADDVVAAAAARRDRRDGPLEAELRERNEEIRDLRAQVRGLKEWVSASTRADGTTSDEVFGAGMANLGNGLQNWVITNFRKSKVDLSRAGETSLQELAELVPMYEELAQTAKVHLLQSVVSKILVQRIFRSYFVGLTPEQEMQLRQTERLLESFGSVESVNQWRSVTLAMLKKDAAHNMQVQTTQTAEDVVTRIERTLDSITTDTSGRAGGSNTAAATSTDARNQALRQLVNSAIELSRLLVMQKAVFEVWMPNIVPHQQIMFDHDTMEDIGGEDEENLVQREICCVTFPGIIKRGDENGGQLQFRNVISKARVLCSAE